MPEHITDGTSCWCQPMKETVPGRHERLYRTKPVIVRAITFDGLVEYGKEHDARVRERGEKMPWSFQYCGEPVTHENDDTYLVGWAGMRMERGDMLVVEDGDLCVYTPGEFHDTYELHEGAIGEDVPIEPVTTGGRA